MNWRVCRLLLIASVLSQCGGGPTPPSGPGPALNPMLAGFQLDRRSGVVLGCDVDLQGDD